ncbi:hypothetical protein FEF65_04405 [Mariprofundus erugo]|uniref:Uncharacterized protein n=1 Tax=Mariprofundus erugo TaxID=2528639 RepID=A0A5R9GPN5_9PROT|nr:NfeD family protein [Mariprofundus erugo]TLS68241.1 hypothetical protein FEF65_04405 [Mariprofundus erugo]
MESLISNSYVFWGLLALLLLLAEAATFTSVAFVFSIAAAIVFLSLFVADAPQSLAGQLLLFAVAGVVLLYPIRRFQKRTATAPTTGDVAASIEGAPGGVIRHADEGGCSGRVLLDHAFLGGREWMFESETVVQPGQRVRIADVHGNILKVDLHRGES